MMRLAFVAMAAVMPLTTLSAQTGSIAAMGYLYPAPIPVAPGQLITVFLQGDVSGNITATLQQAQSFNAPILEVRPQPDCAMGLTASCLNFTAITVQIPYELVPACFVCATPFNYSTTLSVTVDGTPGPGFQLVALADKVHLLTACDTAVPSGNGEAPYSGLPCQPLITHANGALVSESNPASAGEELVAYAVGLGTTTPVIATGQAASTATPATGSFSLDFNFRPNALATKPAEGAPAPLYAGLAPGYPGLYQVNFVVPAIPAGTASCNGTTLSNLTVSVGGMYSFDGAGICVD